jgi:hypothetical protein
LISGRLFGHATGVFLPVRILRIVQGLAAAAAARDCIERSHSSAA